MFIGKNELNTKKEDLETGTDGIAVGPLVGTKLEIPSLGVSVYVNDVARAHIDALNPVITGNQNLFCSSGGPEGTSWDDAKEIAKWHYKKQVADGFFNLSGSSPSRPIRQDASGTEKLLWWKFASDFHVPYILFTNPAARTSRPEFIRVSSWHVYSDVTTRPRNFPCPACGALCPQSLEQKLDVEDITLFSARRSPWLVHSALLRC